ncbi:nuclear transport factor 2 family protein [Novosphingobium sp. KACC 22771]|uniref:nuclear transport factor 2 family protein n=1 Tax=Novosphingobium sp. KACC 22771 TaxID=3025670 RepID=UPI002367335F|nr:nuclear transport factor 2 family protein [Novosphingobium sp. KACC 22771]WDF74321.1 nuclear transport factor 2 family protein [Novosphingobium sp. KACC 22771]
MTVEERLQRLEDDRAIRDLKARYLRACDTQDPEMVAATLLPEVVVAFEGFPPFDSRDAFIAVYRQFGCQPGIHDIHHAANGIVTIESAERATAQWSLLFHQVNLSAGTLTQYGVEYDDAYVKRDGRWWIAETRTTRKSCLLQSVGEDGAIKVTAMGNGENMPS